MITRSQKETSMAQAEEHSAKDLSQSEDQRIKESSLNNSTDIVLGSRKNQCMILSSTILPWIEKYQRVPNIEKTKILHVIYRELEKKGCRILQRDPEDMNAFIPAEKQQCLNRIRREMRKQFEKEEANKRQRTQETLHTTPQPKRTRLQGAEETALDEEEDKTSVTAAATAAVESSETDLFESYLSDMLPLEDSLAFPGLKRQPSSAEPPSLLQAAESGLISVASCGTAGGPLILGDLFTDIWDTGAPGLQRVESSHVKVLEDERLQELTLSPFVVRPSAESAFTAPPTLPFKASAYPQDIGAMILGQEAHGTEPQGASLESPGSIKTKVDKKVVLAAASQATMTAPIPLTPQGKQPAISDAPPALKPLRQPSRLGDISMVPCPLFQTPQKQQVPATPFARVTASPTSVITPSPSLEGKAVVTPDINPKKSSSSKKKKRRYRKNPHHHSVASYQGPSPASLQALSPYRYDPLPLAPMPTSAALSQDAMTFVMVKKFLALEEKAQDLQKQNEDMWNRLSYLEKTMAKDKTENTNDDDDFESM